MDTIVAADADADADALDPTWPRWRLSVADYRRMGKAGILDEDDRVELIEGELVAMSPIGPRHSYAVDQLTRLLVTAVGSRGVVRVQNPVTLNDGTEPSPDVVVARQGWAGFPNTHPDPHGILLLVEVADSSLRIDVGPKRAIYARSALQEYWVVDLDRSVIRVHRRPADGRYADETVCAPPDAQTLSALPDIAIEAAALFF